MGKSLASAALILAAAVVVALHGSPRATAATPSPSWKCIAGICLGQSRASVVYRFGGIVDDTPSQTIRVPGGRVWACYWRCQGAVTEDGFTHYGGTKRLGNRILTVSSCNPTFRLPDGTTWNTRIPFGDRWNGYRRIDLFEPGPRPGWEKIVRRGATKIRVVLDPTQERVKCVYLERAS